jgi:hypothetical protein
MNLMEILPHGWVVYSMGNTITTITFVVKANIENETGLAYIRDYLAKQMPLLLENCRELGLKMCGRQVQRIISCPKEKLTAEYIVSALDELNNRFRDEFLDVWFMHLPTDKVPFYNGKNLFGQDVTDKFPSAIIDIEEAGKCFALARHTACVMHLMRVIEIGLRAVAKGLGIPQAELLPTWQAVISKIESEMKTAANKRPADWLKIEPFYREIPAHLFAIKNAWRNPSMHVQTSYDEERALDIYNAVRGFMRYLAAELSE